MSSPLAAVSLRKSRLSIAVSFYFSAVLGLAHALARGEAGADHGADRGRGDRRRAHGRAAALLAATTGGEERGGDVTFTSRAGLCSPTV